MDCGHSHPKRAPDARLTSRRAAEVYIYVWYLSLSLSINLSLSIYIYTYIDVCVCMYIYIYIYVCTDFLWFSCASACGAFVHGFGLKMSATGVPFPVHLYGGPTLCQAPPYHETPTGSSTSIRTMRKPYWCCLAKHGNWGCKLMGQGGTQKLHRTQRRKTTHTHKHLEN